MIDIFGYIGTVLILYSFTIENIYKLRLINSIGSVFWIIYGIGIMAGPTILVNSCVLCIHTYWFIKHRKNKNANNTKSTKAIRY
jgi:NADH:ubiquinone oxidoreductase subunit 6 (subunit J)